MRRDEDVASRAVHEGRKTYGVVRGSIAFSCAGMLFLRKRWHFRCSSVEFGGEAILWVEDGT